MSRCYRAQRDAWMVMTVEFDEGYFREPFRSLCSAYPGAEVFPAKAFRIEWGPIFHRGRLDGSARVLVIGQDPAANENVLRRILVGTAGTRVQGLLAKLGITRSYVMVNAFLYSVYGGTGSKYAGSQPIIAYRNRWLDALFQASPIEAAIALGNEADIAWGHWDSATAALKKPDVGYAHVLHPTYPDSAGKNDKQKQAKATAALLKNWNKAVQDLRTHIKHADGPAAQVPYGTSFQPSDLVPIPAVDLPAGVPDWMRNQDAWAKRAGTTAAEKRRTLAISVPDGVIP